MLHKQTCEQEPDTNPKRIFMLYSFECTRRWKHPGKLMTIGLSWSRRQPPFHQRFANLQFTTPLQPTCTSPAYGAATLSFHVYYLVFLLQKFVK
jgi:hypothetical protein